jgi:hypothetical protein
MPARRPKEARRGPFVSAARNNAAALWASACIFSCTSGDDETAAGLNGVRKGELDTELAVWARFMFVGPGKGGVMNRCNAADRAEEAASTPWTRSAVAQFSFCSSMPLASGATIVATAAGGAGAATGSIGVASPSSWACCCGGENICAEGSTTSSAVNEAASATGSASGRDAVRPRGGVLDAGAGG